jgi:hypothetical protein
LIISISSIDSTPLLDFSDSPSVTSIVPAIHSTWDGQNPGKDKTSTIWNLNLHKYNHKKRSRGHRTKPEGTWKTLENKIEKKSQACELATNSKILTNLTLHQKSGIN